MALDPELLDKLACPQCKGPLAVQEAGKALDCGACRLRYDVQDDIPVLIIELAKPLAPAAP